MRIKLSQSDWEQIGIQSGWMKEAKRGTCWRGYKQVGMKEKNGRMVPNCVRKDKKG
jgi:hypothetical protein